MKPSRKPGRGLRVADQIQRDVAEMIQREVSTARAGLITLTGVEVSPDFAHAKVFFTSLAEAAQRDEVRAGLKRASGFLRTMLGARMKIHNTPELHFVYDESVESGIRLTHLIEDAVAADAARGKPRRRATRTR